jgi:hypothetical protein
MVFNKSKLFTIRGSEILKFHHVPRYSNKCIINQVQLSSVIISFLIKKRN